jgi:predicted enzyme related to lactoylglutathione lyase
MIVRLSPCVVLLSVFGCAPATPPPPPATPAAVSRASVDAPAVTVAVAPQYDTTHVCVSPEDVDKFVASFLATFGGQSTKQVVTTVTPTPSSTTSQLLQTPAGTVSLFGFKTPIPAPFCMERTGYLVTDLDAAVSAARASGAALIVEPFPDPIGRNAVIQWPGGVNMQLYWHFTKPAYAPFKTVPDNRVYVSKDSADAFIRSFVAFAHGTVVEDEANAPGEEIGRLNEKYRRIRIESSFGKLLAIVTDGHLPYPYGHEMSGYEVSSLDDTLMKARAAGVTFLVEPHSVEGGQAAIVQFPGGYVAEIHAGTRPVARTP